jgi:ATP-dependent DNA ligase
LTADFPALVAAAQELKSRTLIIDGEIVAIEEVGRPSFHALQHHGSKQSPVAFDAVASRRVTFRQQLLHERRQELARLNWPSPIFRSEPLPGSLAQIEAAARRAGLEGSWRNAATPGTRPANEATRG